MSVRTGPLGPPVGIFLPTTVSLVTSGLTHHWPLDDATVNGTTSGAIATDVVGGLNGTITGAGTISSAQGPSGVAGTARQFDGSQTAFVLDAGPEPVGNLRTSQYTVCAWLFLTDITDVTAPMWLNFHDNNPEGYSFCYANQNAGDQFEISANVAAQSPNVTIGNGTSPTFANSTWLMVTSAWDGGGASGINSVWYNSTLVFNLGNNGTSQSSDSTRNTLGARASAARNLPNGWRLGRVMTYNRVLNSAEVAQNFNAK